MITTKSFATPSWDLQPLSKLQDRAPITKLLIIRNSHFIMSRVTKVLDPRFPLQLWGNKHFVGHICSNKLNPQIPAILNSHNQMKLPDQTSIFDVYVSLTSLKISYKRVPLRLQWSQQKKMISRPPCQNEIFLSNRKNTNIKTWAKRNHRLKLSCGSSSAESAYDNHANVIKHSPCTIHISTLIQIVFKMICPRSTWGQTY